MLFETHRDSLLNDLYYTLQVIDLVPDIRLCADLSHFVVDREMRDPITSIDQSYIDRILERSECFQGRVANREQVQIQIEFPQHQNWGFHFLEVGGNRACVSGATGMQTMQHSYFSANWGRRPTRSPVWISESCLIDGKKR